MTIKLIAGFSKPSHSVTVFACTTGCFWKAACRLSTPPGWTMGKQRWRRGKTGWRWSSGFWAGPGQIFEQQQSIGSVNPAGLKRNTRGLYGGMDWLTLTPLPQRSFLSWAFSGGHSGANRQLRALSPAVVKTHGARRRGSRRAFLTKTTDLWLRPRGSAGAAGRREWRWGGGNWGRLLSEGFNRVSEARLSAFIGGSSGVK